MSEKEKRNSLVGVDTPDVAEARRTSLAGVDVPMTSDMVPKEDPDVKALDIIENGDEEVVAIDFTHQRYLEEEQIPVYRVLDVFGDRTWLFIKIFLLLTLIGYTIAVLAIDFRRGVPILYLEITYIGFALLAFLMRRFREQFHQLADYIRNLPLIVYRVSMAVLWIIVIGLAVGLSVDDLTRLYGLLGLGAIILLCYAFSWNRKSVNWRPVAWGFFLQFVFGVFILRTTAGQQMFKFFGDQIQALLTYTNAGVSFVFGVLQIGFDASGTPTNPFVLNVLPVIIFFSGITSILFYLGVLQAFTLAVGNVMVYTMGTSAPESLSAAGNIFLGQTESPLLIRPYLKYMTNSEIHAVMCGGFATIAGGVLAAFISFGVPAEHLLSASVMSAPAALAISKLVYPESVKVDDSAIDKLDLGDPPANALEAFTRGATLSIGLIANIVVNLVAFLALIEFLNEVVKYFLTKLDIFDVNFITIVGYIFSPFALLMGIPAKDMEQAGNLLGVKVIANEFVAFLALTGIDGGDLAFPRESRTFTILTYALCGFSNFSSIGIQLGALGLMAPNKLKPMAKMAFSAMFCGNIACFMTACIAGVLVK